MTHPTARETILKLFRDAADGYVSGAKISEELGVSRTAVWKQVQGLRDLGYRIEAVPSRGYQLQARPDNLLPEELQAGLDTHCVGKVIQYFPVTDSTNLQTAALGEAGAADGLVVIADQQTAGKGRLGRQWVSPAGVNLYASILLRPDILPWDAPQLTFLSAVAVCRAIQDTCGLQPVVKWPNDVLLDGCKVAGLLNEMNSETDRVNFVVLGIGVNLNMTVKQFPEDLRAPATSLAIASGQPVSRLAFTRSLLQHLDALYAEYLEQGLAPVQKAWTELCDMVGQQVRVDCQSQVIQGCVKGLGDDGALLVAMDDGRVERVLAGDVTLA